MNNKIRKPRYRVIPPEYVRIPEGKEALAQRIAAQRQRLIDERQGRQQKNQDTANPLNQEPLLALASVAAASVPAYAAELMKKKPTLSLLIGAGALILIPLAMRKIGVKRLAHGVNALSPILMDYLEARYFRSGK